VSGEEITKLQKFIFKIPLPEHILETAVKLARLSRPKFDDAPDFVKNWVNWGAGPRASQYPCPCSKNPRCIERTHSTVNGRYRVCCYTDPSAQNSLNFAAEAEGITSKDVIHKLLEK